MRVCQVDAGHLGRISILCLRGDRSDEDYGHVSHLDQNYWKQLSNSDSIGVSIPTAISAQLRVQG